jgi:hypothetical protein
MDLVEPDLYLKLGKASRRNSINSNSNVSDLDINQNQEIIMITIPPTTSNNVSKTNFILDSEASSHIVTNKE